MESLNEGEELFCFRVAHKADGSIKDFHCYRYCKTEDAWYAKQGTMNIMLRLREGIYPWTATDADGISVWFDEMAFSMEIGDDELYYLYDVLNDNGSIPTDKMISTGTCYASSIYYFKYKVAVTNEEIVSVV